MRNVVVGAAFMPPTGLDRITVDDTTLDARWVGPRPADAPTIVMLHEGLGSVAQWKDFPERLAAATGCGALAYSRAGYGGSSPVRLPRQATYMHDEALRVLPRVLAAIGFQAGILLGHSDGASIATIYAGGVEDPRVRGLVLIAPHFFVEPMGLEGIERAKIAYETGDLRARLARFHGDNVDWVFRSWSDTWLDPRFRDWDIRDSLARIRVPILIVQGVNDQYGTIAQIDVARQQAQHAIEVALIADAKHAPHFEQRDITERAIIDFIAKALAGP
jgi:pimeloyl-ACP methyl ester carboxylesterase